MAEVSAPRFPEPSESPVQSRAYGWFLLVLSWLMRLAGGAVAINTQYEGIGRPAPGHWSWGSGIASSVVSVVVMSIGLGVVSASLVVGRRARQHLARIVTSVAELTPRSYVLYLRPFRQDRSASGFAYPLPRSHHVNTEVFRSGRTHEEWLARMFRQFGPMITVGLPGEELPAGSGAWRFYLPREDWQDPVRELIDNARVILLSAGPGEGTIWEYAEVVRRARHLRLVVLVTDPQWYAQFSALTAAVLRAGLPELARQYGDQWQPPVLPALPPPKNLKWKGGAFYFRAMIYFGPDWRASLASFDRSVALTMGLGPYGGYGRYLKKRLKPVLAHLTMG